MTTRKPQLVEQYLPGIDPAKRLRHRGLLRSIQYTEGIELSDIPNYIAYTKKRNPGIALAAQPPIGKIEADGFHYFYGDEFVSQAETIQEAAVILKRSRSTLNGYMKHKTFPKSKNAEGAKSVDIIAAQDWILEHTDHHVGLEPYWPEIEENILICMHVDELFKNEQDAEFHIFHAEPIAA